MNLQDIDKNTDRSYLFGRLIGAAEFIEGIAGDDAQQIDATAYDRMHYNTLPAAEVWEQVYTGCVLTNLGLIEQRQGNIANFLKLEIDSIINLFACPADFLNAEKLKAPFLLGKHAESSRIRDELKKKFNYSVDTLGVVDAL